MEKLLISHKTAFKYWVGGPARPHPGLSRCSLAESDELVSSVKLLRAELAKLSASGVELAPAGGTSTSSNDGDRKYDLTVDKQGKVNRARLVNSHLFSSALTAKSVCALTERLCVSTPELTFQMLARDASAQELIAYGTSMCSTYSVFQGSNRYVDERVSLTSVFRIGACLSRGCGSSGVSHARRAVQWLCEGAASRREATLAIIFFTPRRYGGFGLPRPKLNYRVYLDDRAKSIARLSFVIADFVWPDKRLILEYDSNKFHSSNGRLAEDSRRRNALIKMGYKVVVATNDMLVSPAGRMGLYSTLAKELYPRGRRSREWDSLLMGKLTDAAFRIPSGNV